MKDVLPELSKEARTIHAYMLYRIRGILRCDALYMLVVNNENIQSLD